MINNFWKNLYLLSQLDYFNNSENKSLQPHEQFVLQSELTLLTTERDISSFINNYLIEYSKNNSKIQPTIICKAILDFFSLLIIPKSTQITLLLSRDIFEGSVDGINLNSEAYFLDFIFMKAKDIKKKNPTNYFTNFLSKSNDLNVPLYHNPIFKEHERLWITLFQYLFCKK